MNEGRNESSRAGKFAGSTAESNGKIAFSILKWANKAALSLSPLEICFSTVGKNLRIYY